jgi:hypothetical protein
MDAHRSGEDLATIIHCSLPGGGQDFGMISIYERPTIL